MPENKEFEEWVHSYCFRKPDEKSYEIMKDAYFAGQQSERDKWISVTERLPTEKDGDIYEEDSAFKEKYIFVIVKTKKRRIPCKYYIDIKRFVISNVISWQPLPEV